MKCAGRGHDDGGVAGTKQGELALRCHACPQPGWNLPDDWETMDKDQRYKYFTELAEDANFKLINCAVSTEQRDPVLDDSCGYFANQVEYAEHIRKHVGKEEISSCSGFQAMFLTNVKRVKGLRVTGIGGAGERHCNMDFLMFASLLGCIMSFLIMSYDVACQFSKHIWTRMENLPEKYHLKIKVENVRWMVPNFHLPAHKKGCHSAFSFHWLWGGGGTTKLMGLGARYTALEGLFGFHNWRWLVAHRQILMERMTLKQIHHKLATEEYARTGDGVGVEREDSVSTFLVMGMDIEEMQRQLAISIKAASHTHNESRTRFSEALKLTLCLFGRFPKTPNNKAIWDADDQQPEATRLFMPSDLSCTKDRQGACTAGLDGTEAQLRTGKVGDALADLRQGLRTRTMTNRFKIRNWSGQRALTRGQGIIRQINIKIHGAKLRYRYACQALYKLKGRGDWEAEFQVLNDEDVRAVNDHALREEEQAQDELWGVLGMAKNPVERAVVVSGESHHILSWIWFTSPKAGASDAKLHEALCVEWCKAYSVNNRFREHLVKVEEEMRRTIHSGELEEAVWRARVNARTVMLGCEGKMIDPAVAEGVHAYAFEQADREKRVCKTVAKDWAPLRERAAAYLRGEDVSGLPKLEIDLDEDQLRWADGPEVHFSDPYGDFMATVDALIACLDDFQITLTVPPTQGHRRTRSLDEHNSAIGTPAADCEHASTAMSILRKMTQAQREAGLKKIFPQPPESDNDETLKWLTKIQTSNSWLQNWQSIMTLLSKQLHQLGMPSKDLPSQALLALSVLRNPSFNHVSRSLMR
ncbi:hypothetical protein C8R43DRAFT_1116179 [Mycena crocata]|nr:hypothetical protein C8R43DRAFT_1116179 [Mycena crocata]